MRNPMSRRKKTLIAVLAACLGIALLAGILLFFTRMEQRADKEPEGAGLALSRTSTEETEDALAANGISADSTSGAEIPTIYYNGQQYVYNDSLSSLLILGIDDNELVETASVRNKSQADFLLLAVFDPEKRACTLLQLNRDTMCDIPMLDSEGNYTGLLTGQLALAHTYGNGMEKSCENTVYAVSRLLYGVTIENYFAVTMDAIPVLNDLVGGVTVTIEDDFTGVDDSLIQGETVTLTAENVESFVRARMAMQDDPTNLARMRRQRTYITGLFQALSKSYAQDSSFVVEAYSAIAGSLVTDCTIDEMSDYAERFAGYTLAEIITPEGESVKGDQYMEFYVDEEALQQVIIETFYMPAEE